MSEVRCETDESSGASFKPRRSRRWLPLTVLISALTLAAAGSAAGSDFFDAQARSGILGYISSASPTPEAKPSVLVTNAGTPIPSPRPTAESILAVPASPKPSPDPSAPYGSMWAEIRATVNAKVTADTFKLRSASTSPLPTYIPITTPGTPVPGI